MVTEQKTREKLKKACERIIDDAIDNGVEFNICHNYKYDMLVFDYDGLDTYLTSIYGWNAKLLINSALEGFDIEDYLEGFDIEEHYLEGFDIEENPSLGFFKRKRLAKELLMKKRLLDFLKK